MTTTVAHRICEVLDQTTTTQVIVLYGTNNDYKDTIVDYIMDHNRSWIKIDIPQEIQLQGTVAMGDDINSLAMGGGFNTDKIIYIQKQSGTIVSMIDEVVKQLPNYKAIIISTNEDFMYSPHGHVYHV